MNTSTDSPVIALQTSPQGRSRVQMPQGLSVTERTQWYLANNTAPSSPPPSPLPSTPPAGGVDRLELGMYDSDTEADLVDTMTSMDDIREWCDQQLIGVTDEDERLDIQYQGKALMDIYKEKSGYHEREELLQQRLDEADPASRETTAKMSSLWKVLQVQKWGMHSVDSTYPVQQALGYLHFKMEVDEATLEEIVRWYWARPGLSRNDSVKKLYRVSFLGEILPDYERRLNRYKMQKARDDAPNPSEGAGSSKWDAMGDDQQGKLLHFLSTDLPEEHRFINNLLSNLRKPGTKTRKMGPTDTQLETVANIVREMGAEVPQSLR